MNTTATDLKLNNGTTMPALGLGVFQSPQKETADAVETAIETGYRLIDTAAAYMNESAVGEGIRRTGVKRSDLFIVTKLWISDYGSDAAVRGFEASLRRLGTDYVDLYLMHQPMPNEFDRTLAAYRKLETFVKDGRARAIGVSNFGSGQLERLVGDSYVVPAVNQIEVHPFFVQKKLRDLHQKLGITTQAWSPIAGINVYRPEGKEALNPHRHPALLQLAEKYGKSPSQIMLRWHLQIGNCAIPKSIHAGRIKENFDVFSFTLTSDEIAKIESLDTGVRSGPNPDDIDTKSFPFAIDNSPAADTADREYKRK